MSTPLPKIWDKECTLWWTVCNFGMQALFNKRIYLSEIRANNSYSKMHNNNCNNNNNNDSNGTCCILLIIEETCEIIQHDMIQFPSIPWFFMSYYTMHNVISKVFEVYSINTLNLFYYMFQQYHILTHISFYLLL